MKKIIITNGLIAGAIVTAFMVYSTIEMQKPDFQPSMVLGYAGMLIAYVFVFLGIKNYRDNHNNGVITFGQGFKIGMLISLIASTIYVGVWLIEYYCFFPDFMEKFSAMSLKNLNKTTMTAAEIKAKTDEINMFKEWYKNPIWVILLTYAEILIPIGLLVPVISALILKRKTVATETI
ncbi:DUF4199 domain-containing protein [Flavobacterium sp.]|uniref:DUF4199 domain-containing protein n=1 Tax=Flavobacterium sp. TaxID=239 RepID=UPI00391B10BB